jgi:hypothetical protein
MTSIDHLEYNVLVRRDEDNEVNLSQHGRQHWKSVYESSISGYESSISG